MSRRRVPAPARTVAVHCACLARTRTRCSTSCRCAGASCATSAPNTVAGYARPSVGAMPGAWRRRAGVQAPAPVSAVARGKATFATLAHIVVSKFDHHLPLYRQAEMMAAQGLDIDRSTLAGWTGQAAVLLDPIVTCIRDEVLKADKIHADDTPVPVLDPGRGKTATGRLWVYAADDQASGGTAPRATWYRFTPDRTRRTPAGPPCRLSRFPSGRCLCRL